MEIVRVAIMNMGHNGGIFLPIVKLCDRKDGGRNGC